MNNLIIFALPLFLFINSYSVQFHLIKNQIDNYNYRSYSQAVKNNLFYHWKSMLVMTVITLLLIISINISFEFSSLNYMIAPLLITSSFIINSFYYYLNYYLNNEEDAGKKKGITSSLLLSYGNIPAYLKNVLLMVIQILITLYISPIVLLVIGDSVCRLILRNMK